MAVVCNLLVNQCSHPARQAGFFYFFRKKGHIPEKDAVHWPLEEALSCLLAVGQRASARSDHHWLSLEISIRPLLDGVSGLMNPPVDHGRETMVVGAVACIEKNGPVETIVSSHQDRRRTIQ